MKEAHKFEVKYTDKDDVKHRTIVPTIESGLAGELEAVAELADETKSVENVREI